MNKTKELVGCNKEVINNNSNKSQNLNHNNSTNNTLLSNNTNNINNISTTSGNESKINNSDLSINSKENDELDIKVINSLLKKDITGKPFLDYICEIKKKGENYRLNKKFGHFLMLHKALKSLFKDMIKLPEGGNLFINLNEMKQNTFHENKLEQLDKYVSDLLQIEPVKRSIPFRNFFELDEAHEQKIIGMKPKIMIEKKV